jgi:hypothetical protein
MPAAAIAAGAPENAAARSPAAAAPASSARAVGGGGGGGAAPGASGPIAGRAGRAGPGTPWAARARGAHARRGAERRRRRRRWRPAGRLARLGARPCAAWRRSGGGRAAVPRGRGRKDEKMNMKVARLGGSTSSKDARTRVEARRDGVRAARAAADDGRAATAGADSPDSAPAPVALAAQAGAAHPAAPHWATPVSPSRTIARAAGQRSPRPAPAGGAQCRRHPHAAVGPAAAGGVPRGAERPHDIMTCGLCLPIQLQISPPAPTRRDPTSRVIRGRRGRAPSPSAPLLDPGGRRDGAAHAHAARRRRRGGARAARCAPPSPRPARAAPPPSPALAPPPPPPHRALPLPALTAPRPAPPLPGSEWDKWRNVLVGRELRRREGGEEQVGVVLFSVRRWGRA